MVDWVLAGQIARYAAGRSPAPTLEADLPGMADEALGHVAAYTGLTAAGEVPRGEVVSREQWADINLATLTDLLDPVAGRLESRLNRAGPLAGALRTAAGATLAAEAGLVVGYMSQRVLGQFELSLLAPEQPTRLLFVGPNLANATNAMDVDSDSFLRWVALHEVTHVLQFTGVPWLRDHLGGLMRAYMKTLDVQINRGAAGGLPSLPDPARLYREFREGGLMALIQSGEQRKIMDGVQATMAVIEGYSEHVMDAVGEDVLPAYAGLREAMDARRASRSTPERILQKLLGFDLKMRQYEVGKRFCDAVVAEEGIEGLNRVWESPQSLPTLSELSRPGAWMRRTGLAKAA
jgi:coenzyme F420 biosynthesis associated uncharacterized protein